MIEFGTRKISIDDIDEAFGHWFAGFVDGEGCFSAVKDNNTIRVELVIVLRDDDTPLLEEIQQTLGIGRIYHNDHFDKDRPRANPRARYSISSRADILRLVIPLFDRYPLHSKKQRDFKIWREIVMGLQPFTRKGVQIPPGPKTQLLRLIEQLKETRKYGSWSDTANNEDQVREMCSSQTAFL